MTSNEEHSRTVPRSACCGSCRWWHKGQPIYEINRREGFKEATPTGYTGECRRNAPVQKWPPVTDKDLCGQYVWEYA